MNITAIQTPKPIHAPLPDMLATPEKAADGVWFLPSRNREDRARACMQACIDTGQRAAGLLIEDGCDYRLRFLNLRYPRWGHVVLDEHHELAGALNAGWEAWRGKSWYGVISDGIRPQTQDWDRLMIAAMEGRYIVSCSDSGWREDTRLAGIHVIPGWIVEALGYLYPKGLTHLYIDDVWEHIGQALGNWRYLPDVKVIDRHWANPVHTADADANNKRTFKGQPFAEADRQRFLEWRFRGEFTEAITRIKDAWKLLTGQDWPQAASRDAALPQKERNDGSPIPSALFG